MKKLSLVLMIMFLTSSVLAADSQIVVMNTKTTIAPTANGLKNAPKIVSKSPNKKPKLKEQGLVKSATGRIRQQL